MTPEMQKAFDDAAIPFYRGGGAITIEQTRLQSWRYFLEINSACTLRCPTCTKGNIEGYEHQNGFMDMDLMERILDKIALENPGAIVFTYGNSEPFVHPKLPECIAAIKRRGLRPEMSTNLNHVRRVDELLEAGPGLIIISLSGFTQEVYVKGHAGGNIEKVKANMKILADANNARPKDRRVYIMVNYHVYKDNAHEVDLMKEYAESLDIGFFTSLARAISMEKTIQYCRERDPDATPFEVQPGRPDWNLAFPAVDKIFSGVMDRVRIKPTEARAMYQDTPIQPVCPVGAGSMFTFIRHDGKTSMCSCVADRRITVGDYLDTTPDQMIEQRANHAICQQCIKYRLNLYFHIADRDKWNP
jgi:MoaA/NifB/PqqE/SkfB family radical SAM enzyme